MGDRVRVFTSQRKVVMEIVDKENEYFAEKKHIASKYKEVSAVFLSIYEWFTNEASKIVEKPTQAESAIWVFKDAKIVDASNDENHFTTLSVPKDEIVFFDMYEYIDIINGRFLSLYEGEDKEYNEMIKNYGVKQKSDVYITNFYPELKSKLFESWKRIFRNHEQILNGEYDITAVQGAIWTIKKEWIEE